MPSITTGPKKTFKGKSCATSDCHKEIVFEVSVSIGRITAIVGSCNEGCCKDLAISRAIAKVEEGDAECNRYMNQFLERLAEGGEGLVFK